MKSTRCRACYRTIRAALSVALGIIFLPLLAGCATENLWKDYDGQPPVLRKKRVAAEAHFDRDNTLVFSLRGRELSRVLPHWDPESQGGTLTISPSHKSVARLLRKLPPSARAELCVLVKQEEPSAIGNARSTQNVQLEIKLSGSSSDPEFIGVIDQMHARIDSIPGNTPVRWSIQESASQRLTAEIRDVGWTPAPEAISVRLECEYWAKPTGWPFMWRLLLTPAAVATDAVFGLILMIGSGGGGIGIG